MAKTQLERDGDDIGFAIEGDLIVSKQAARGAPSRGARAGAKATVEQSTGAPSTMARLTTSLKDQGKLQGRGRVFVTVVCGDGVTLINEVKPKHELAARRWVAQLNAG